MRGLDFTQKTTKSHRRHLEPGTSIKVPAYGNDWSVAVSGWPRKEASEVAMGTKKSLDRAEGQQGRWKQRASAKAGAGCEGRVEPQVLRPSENFQAVLVLERG